jgi:cell division FtsZ-interacting protein ZapD
LSCIKKEKKTQKKVEATVALHCKPPFLCLCSSLLCVFSTAGTKKKKQKEIKKQQKEKKEWKDVLGLKEKREREI